MPKSRMAGDSITVERVIAAPASEIFSLVANPARHREFDGSGACRGAKYEGGPVHVGSVFVMGMRMVVPYRMANEIVELEPDRVVAWRTSLGTKLARGIGGRIWRYELAPVDGGTLVKETWDLSGELMGGLLKRTPFVDKTKRNMEQTLERIAQLLTKATTI